MADFGATELDAFRAEVRDWLAANYPAELRDPKAADRPGGRSGAAAPSPAATIRRSSGCARVAARGWTAPTWPTEYGGGGLTAEQARVVDQELAAGHYRPPLASFGIWMLGPVLLEYANEAQKREHLPKIIQRRDPLVPGLFRAGRRLRPRQPGHPLRGRGRPLADQRPEDLDLLRQQGRLVLLPGAHRHHQEARGHQLRPDRHGHARASRPGRSS